MKSKKVVVFILVVKMTEFMVIFGSEAESRPEWTRMVAVVYGEGAATRALRGFISRVRVMLPKVVSAMKGSIRHTNQVIRQHNSQADSRCSASAAPLASQSAIVSRFDGSGAKILTRLDFGENEIAHLQRTARTMRA